MKLSKPRVALRPLRGLRSTRGKRLSLLPSENWSANVEDELRVFTTLVYREFLDTLTDRWATPILNNRPPHRSHHRRIPITRIDRRGFWPAFSFWTISLSNDADAPRL